MIKRAGLIEVDTLRKWYLGPLLGPMVEETDGLTWREGDGIVKRINQCVRKHEK